MNRSELQAQLKGNTLRVYIYCLRHRRVGVREVQRALGLSNPSLAQYHLSKLVELGLLKESLGEYELASDVKVDILRDFLRIGTLLVPRFVFYAVFYSILALYLLLQMAHGPSSLYYAWAIALLGAAAGIFWYEALSAWASAPPP